MESQLALNNVLVIGEIEKKSLTKATIEAISAAKSIAKNQVELLLFSSKSYEKDSLIIKGLDVVFLTPFDLSEAQKVELIAKTAITYPDLRWKKRNIKSVSLLANVLAAAEASKKSSYEAILIENGYVTEGTASNIWIIKNKTIRTHPANSDILRGITRDSVKKLIKKYKLRLIEKKIKKKSLYESDEVFLTSSSNFVTPIIKIDNKLINKGRIGNITMELAKLYKLRIN